MFSQQDRNTRRCSSSLGEYKLNREYRCIQSRSALYAYYASCVGPRKLLEAPPPPRVIARQLMFTTSMTKGSETILLVTKRGEKNTMRVNCGNNNQVNLCSLLSKFDVRKVKLCLCTFLLCFFRSC